MCEEMALSVQDVDAAGLLLSTVDADIVALNGEDVRRACDGAVLGYHFDAEDDSSFESSTKVITI
jgi:hypothetical protein